MWVIFAFTYNLSNAFKTLEICTCVNVMKTRNVRWRFIDTFLNIWQRNVVYNQRLGVQRVKANIIKIIFCCYHVQISLTMSQQTQSDIFHTKMLQNALWCQVTWSKCMLCNILEYCSQTLDLHGHRVLQLILFLFLTL
jgi:hypothetical protein